MGFLIVILFCVDIFQGFVALRAEEDAKDREKEKQAQVQIHDQTRRSTAGVGGGSYNRRQTRAESQMVDIRL